MCQKELQRGEEESQVEICTWNEKNVKACWNFEVNKDEKRKHSMKTEKLIRNSFKVFFYVGGKRFFGSFSLAGKTTSKFITFRGLVLKFKFHFQVRVIICHANNSFWIPYETALGIYFLFSKLTDVSLTISREELFCFPVWTGVRGILLMTNIQLTPHTSY